MKKKIVSTLLCTAMLVTMMAGCGGSNAANTSTNSGSNAADTKSDAAATTDEAAPATEAASADTSSDASASDEGKVLNIYCWNEEFKSRLTDHYPGYTEVDATTGSDRVSTNLQPFDSKGSKTRPLNLSLTIEQ